MKLFVVCFLGLVVLSTAAPPSLPPVVQPPSRGCFYILGRCVEQCPEGTHAYTTGCGRKLPEASCEQPNPVLEKGILCDYSDCYCDPPTVREAKSNKCVKLEDCPKKE